MDFRNLREDFYDLMNKADDYRAQEQASMTHPLPPEKPVGRVNCPNVIRERNSALRTQVGGDHYNKLRIQPMEYILANNIRFPEGSVIKYVTRWQDKNGVQDLRKAKQTIEVIIEDALMNGWDDDPEFVRKALEASAQCQPK